MMLTFAILGIAYAKAFTTNLSPLFLLINLKGLPILKILMIFKLLDNGVRDMIDSIIMMKSSMFQGFLR